MAAVTKPHRERMLPSFFLVGAAKAGTTSLWSLIEQHPQIGTPIGVKEPQYFLWAEEDQEYDFRGWKRIPRSYHDDLDAYLDLFEVKPETRILGEGSPQYLAHPKAPEKIAAKVPEAKILICLREPVARAWSHYTYNRMRTEEREPDFMKAIEAELASRNPYFASAYVALGKYADQVPRWQATFGEDRVKVVLTEDLRTDLEGTARDVFEFLDLDRDVPLTRAESANTTQAKHPLTDAIYGIRTSDRAFGTLARAAHARLAKSSAYRNLQRRVIRSARGLAARAGAGRPEPIPAHAKAFLTDYYAEDVRRLEQLIGRDLSAWRRTTRERTTK